MTPATGFYVGVDTHTDTHTMAVLDHMGRTVSTSTHRADPDGYAALLAALPGPGDCLGVGVEGTNSYGAALARRLAAGGWPVREVLRPKRAVRRRDGKSDPIDAVEAARCVARGDGDGTPKSSDGWVEALRHLNTERSRLVAAMTMLSNSTGGLLVTAPEPVRERYRGMRATERMRALASARPSGGLVERCATEALRAAARAWRTLDEQAGLLESRMRAILDEHAPQLLAVHGVGTVIAATLAVVAGDNPERIHSEAAFAKLCGACPLPASSGRTDRHRLNRGGNRQGNMALHRIAVVRLAHHKPTRDYMDKRTRQGKTKREVIRCLKRYIAREIYKTLVAIRRGTPQPPTPAQRGARLRELRRGHGITQQQIGRALSIHPSRVSEIERGARDLPELEHRITQWIHTTTQTHPTNTLDKQ